MENRTYYISDINSNSLVVNDVTCDYRIRMLESNKINGLLRAHLSEDEGRKEVRYDISSKTTLSKKLESQLLSAEDVRRIIKCIAAILHGMKQYLLVASDIVIDPDYIYVNNSVDSDGDTSLLQFCYIPGYSGNFARGLSELLRKILGAVDHEDKDGVVLAYNLYQESMKDNYVIEDLERIVNA